MKNKTTKLMALLAVLSLSAVSCQKENTPLSVADDVVTDHQAVYIYQYQVNGISSRITLHGEAERISFLNRMIALAAEGCQVSFFDETQTTQIFSKETVTYSTEDKNQAIAWLISMLDKGYEVTITFNEKTGCYDCTATK